MFACKLLLTPNCQRASLNASPSAAPAGPGLPALNSFCPHAHSPPQLLAAAAREEHVRADGRHRAGEDGPERVRQAGQVEDEKAEDAGCEGEEEVDHDAPKNGPPRNRTGMTLRSVDFESTASASSARGPRRDL